MPLILGTNSIKDTGFNVANSLRFNDGSSDYLTFTPSGNGNRKVFTISLWVKRANLGSQQNIIGSNDTSFGNGLFVEFQANDTLRFGFTDPNQLKATNRVFRDVSAWYHIVVAIDVTQSSNSDKVKIYVNGVQETSFGTDDTVTDADKNWNNTQAHSIGRSGAFNGFYFDGYLAEVVNIDGSQLAPDQFGEFDDSGIWKPIDVSGLTFGTNGFYLDFEDSSALGNDAAGSNNFTVNNLTAIDQSSDSCTNNFATLNPLASLPNTGVSTFSEGNLVSQGVNGSYVNGGSTFQMTTGKWYAEVKYLATSSDVGRIIIGITQDVSEISRLNQDNGSLNTTYNNYDGAGGKNVQGTGSTYGSDFGLNDIIGIALDLDNEKLYFSVNGTWQNSGVPTSGSTGTGAITGFSSPSSSISGGYFFFSGSNSNAQNNTVSWNFGSPSFSISSGNTDGNGYGNFEYAVPSGYYALNTKNLAEYG
nr:spry domain protein [uncultured Mediterranean phage uvMED]